MHPAWSVIVFTVLSGQGFGFMFWLGLGAMRVDGMMAFSVCALAFVFASVGLLSSTLHLGHPERAWKAFSQWRSSWLSREGVVSVLTLAVFGLYAWHWVVGGVRYVPLGWLASALALATVFCTAMIYRQLKTVPRWHTPLTPVLFILYALAVPALMTGWFWIGLLLLVALAFVQVKHWGHGDKGIANAATPESATGLGHLGQVRLLESPNSAPNYLMKEMVHQVGRKRAAALRQVAVVAALGLPLVFALGTVAFGFSHLLALLVFVVHIVGVLASRWLFFAEAQHVVGVYYGQR